MTNRLIDLSPDYNKVNGQVEILAVSNRLSLAMSICTFKVGLSFSTPNYVADKFYKGVMVYDLNKGCENLRVVCNKAQKSLDSKGKQQIRELVKRHREQRQKSN